MNCTVGSRGGQLATHVSYAAQRRLALICNPSYTQQLPVAVAELTSFENRHFNVLVTKRCVLFLPWVSLSLIFNSASLLSMNSTNNFWSERCISATQQPLSALLLKLYASYGSVIAAFGVTTLLSTCLLIRLCFVPREIRRRMWKLLPVFISLLLFGSLSGIVAWSFRILIRVEDYTAIKVSDKAQAQEIISQKYRVQGGWFGFYGVQFFCLSLAKLLVRRRSISCPPPSASYFSAQLSPSCVSGPRSFL